MLSRTADDVPGVRRRPTPLEGDGSEDAARPRQPPAGAVRGGVSDGADGAAGRMGAAAVAGADGCDRAVGVAHGRSHSGEPGRDTTGDAAHEALRCSLEVEVGSGNGDDGLSSRRGDDDDALSPKAA